MSKEIKQKADELVSMFWRAKNKNERFISITQQGALSIAILHQERLIEELVLNSGYVNYFYKFNYLDNIKMQKKILTELKSRL